MRGKIVGGTTIKGVRPEGCIYEQCSDILPNWGIYESRYGYRICEVSLDIQRQVKSVDWRR